MCGTCVCDEITCILRVKLKKGKGKGSEGKSEHGVVFCFTRTVLHVLYKEEVESIPKNVVLV